MNDHPSESSQLKGPRSSSTQNLSTNLPLPSKKIQPTLLIQAIERGGLDQIQLLLTLKVPLTIEVLFAVIKAPNSQAFKLIIMDQIQQLEEEGNLTNLIATYKSFIKNTIMYSCPWSSKEKEQKEQMLKLFKCYGIELDEECEAAALWKNSKEILEKIEKLNNKTKEEQETKKKRRITTFLVACASGHTDLMSAFLTPETYPWKTSTLLTQTNGEGLTALSLVARNNHTITLQCLVPTFLGRKDLVEGKYHSNTRNPYAFGFAAENGCGDLLKKAIFFSSSQSSSAEAEDEEKKFVILWVLPAAIKGGSVDLVQWLMQKYKIPCDMHHIVSAVKHKHTELLKFLLTLRHNLKSFNEAPSNYKEEDANDFPLLCLATRNNDLTTVQELAQYTHVKILHDAMFIAAENGNTPILHFLSGLPGVDIRVRDEPDKNTLLLRTARGDHTETVRWLLLNKIGGRKLAYLGERNNRGYTAFLEAAESGGINTVQWLLKAELVSALTERVVIDNGQQRLYTYTALPLAAYKGHLTMVKLLMPCFLPITDEINGIEIREAFRWAATGNHLNLLEYFLEEVDESLAVWILNNGLPLPGKDNTKSFLKDQAEERIKRWRRQITQSMYSGSTQKVQPFSAQPQPAPSAPPPDAQPQPSLSALPLLDPPPPYNNLQGVTYQATSTLSSAPLPTPQLKAKTPSSLQCNSQIGFFSNPNTGGSNASPHNSSTSTVQPISIPRKPLLLKPPSLRSSPESPPHSDWWQSRNHTVSYSSTSTSSNPTITPPSPFRTVQLK